MDAGVQQRAFARGAEQARRIEQNHGDQNPALRGLDHVRVHGGHPVAQEIVGAAVVLVGDGVLARHGGHDGGQIDVVGRLADAQRQEVLLGAVQRFDAGRLGIGGAVFRHVRGEIRHIPRARERFIAREKRKLRIEPVMLARKAIDGNGAAGRAFVRAQRAARLRAHHGRAFAQEQALACRAFQAEGNLFPPGFNG